jgi:carbon storage regulator
MLVLTRKSEQSIIIGNSIQIKVLAVHGDQVSLGFSAPPDVSIYRQEVYEAIQKENLSAVRRGKTGVEHLQQISKLFGEKNKTENSGKE